MGEMMHIIEEAAKEMYGVWSGLIDSDIRAHGFKVADSSWETLPALQKAAWIAVALHVTDETAELVDMLRRGEL